MNLIDELKNHLTNENSIILNDLLDLIIEENIKTDKELEIYEKVSNSNQSNEEVVKFYLHDIDTSISEFDRCNLDSMHKLQNLRNVINSSEEGIKNLIIYCSLTDRINPFPYITYNFIINDKL